ncbi:MAG: hypothetical protein Q7J82_01180 [Coriobacteriia bacterium]|nr:hypothetical protein [Coriobacteriia bacterium]
MLIGLIAAVLASAATGYLIGHAFIAPKESFLRTKFGMYVLVALGLSFLFLPPQLTSVDTLTGSLGTQVPSGIASALVWPAGVSRGLYIAMWLALTVVGLLVGLRIWDAGKPGWRPGARSSVESAAERAQGMLPLAASLDEVLLTLGKAPLTPRDIGLLEPQLLLAGARFRSQLPEKRSDAFNLVVRHVPASVAVRVTELLQEGAATQKPID